MLGIGLDQFLEQGTKGRLAVTGMVGRRGMGSGGQRDKRGEQGQQTHENPSVSKTLSPLPHVHNGPEFSSRSGATEYGGTAANRGSGRPKRTQR